MKTNMIKKLMVIVISLIIFNVQYAIAQDMKSVKHANSLLWEISGNGLGKPSFLFGTVHIIDSAYYFMDEIVIEKLMSCDKVAFEVDKSDSLFLQKTAAVLMMRNDSLDNIISKEDYEKVKIFFAERLSLPLDKLKKIKPYYLTSFVASVSLPANIMSYEEELMKIASKQDKEIRGVSTVEKESEILVDRVPLEIQAKMLLEAIDSVDNMVEMRDKLIKAYLESDIDSFYAITTSENKYEIVNESMFEKRHELWIPNMIQLMSKYSCFFAVGVAHLAGEHGLIELLKLQGYKVKPINK
jgi:uncharacterized protein YbaP (TraB family)